MSIGSLVRSVYHEMQRHYPTFRILVWLKEKGVTRRVNHLIGHGSDDYERNHPTKKMLASRDFFNGADVKVCVKNIMKLLADDKSCAVYGGYCAIGCIKNLFGKICIQSMTNM